MYRVESIMKIDAWLPVMKWRLESLLWSVACQSWCPINCSCSFCFAGSAGNLKKLKSSVPARLSTNHTLVDLPTNNRPLFLAELICSCYIQCNACRAARQRINWMLFSHPDVLATYMSMPIVETVYLSDVEIHTHFFYWESAKLWSWSIQCAFTKT